MRGSSLFFLILKTNIMTYEEYISYIKEQEKLPDSDFNYPAVREYHKYYLFLGKWKYLDLYIHIDEMYFEEKWFKQKKLKEMNEKENESYSLHDPTFTLNCTERQEVLDTFSLTISDATVYGNEPGEHYTMDIELGNLYHKFSKYSGYYKTAEGYKPHQPMRRNKDIAKRRLHRLEILKRWNQFVFNHFIKREENKLLTNT